MTNIISVKPVGKHQTHDLEVNHPDHQYYLANGMLTSNSHSILYSITSYTTAMLKTHFPIEFLVANLISEVSSNAKVAKENISKIKSEIRAHNVKIVPPAINTSELSWKIVDDHTLMTGLDSLKYVSSNDAIPEIIEKRPFTSFQDLLYRTTPTKLRAQAIQAMAASGSLDEFGIDRKLMFLYASDYRAKLKAHMNKLEKLWAKEWAKQNGFTKKKDAVEDYYVNSESVKQIIPGTPTDRVNEHLATFNYPFPEEKPWSIQELYAFEEFYLGEGLSGDNFSRYPNFFDRNKSVPFSALAEMFPYEQKDEDERKNRKANTYYLGNYKIRPLEAIITSLFVFTVKKEDSPIFGQEMARITIIDPWGDESGLLCFPEAWAAMKTRIEKELSGGKQKVEPTLAIRFLGSFQWENDHATSFVLSDILDYKAAPRLPDDRKSKKVKMPRGKKVKPEEVEELTKEELFELLEEEILDEGMDNIESED